MSGHGQRWVRAFRSYGILKSGASHLWFDKSSRMIESFLHADSDSIIFDKSLIKCEWICLMNITLTGQQYVSYQQCPIS